MSEDDLRRIERQRVVEPGDVDDLIEEIRRLRNACGMAARSLVRECTTKNVDTLWHSDFQTLWEFLNENGEQLEEPAP